MINNTIYIYRYEDVALFKSGVINEACQDPSSQVSSSTDSGYGHGAHIYERIADFNHNKHSGMELTFITYLSSFTHVQNSTKFDKKKIILKIERQHQFFY